MSDFLIAIIVICRGFIRQVPDRQENWESLPLINLSFVLMQYALFRAILQVVR